MRCTYHSAFSGRLAKKPIRRIALATWARLRKTAKSANCRQFATGLAEGPAFAITCSQAICRALLDWEGVFDDNGRSMGSAGNLDNQTGIEGLVPGIDRAHKPGLISVIIPTFNRKALVREALASVVAQTWQNTEIIVIDDGSDDGTFECLRAWRTQNPDVALSIIKQANSGVACARNAGLSRARGEFLYMLDSDDLIFPEALETLVRLIGKGNAPYALANIHCADAKGRILDGEKAGISKLSNGNFYSNQWMTHAALYRRSTLVRSGLFNRSLLVGEDSEFKWRVFAQSGFGTKTSKYIGVRRQHSFGHLCFNRTDIQCLQHSLQARLAFIDWLKWKKMEIPKIDTRQSIGVFGTAFRFGSAGDWKSKDDTMLHFKLTAKRPAGKLSFLWIIGKPNWRPYYHLLLAIYLCAKSVRDTFRFIGNLRFFVRPRQKNFRFWEAT